MAEALTFQEIQDLIGAIKDAGNGKDLTITSSAPPYSGDYWHWINISVSKPGGEDVTDQEAIALVHEIQSIADGKGLEASASATPYEGYKYYWINLSVRRKDMWIAADGEVYQ